LEKRIRSFVNTIAVSACWFESGYASIQRVKWSPITKLYLLLFLLLGKGPITSIQGFVVLLIQLPVIGIHTLEFWCLLTEAPLTPQQFIPQIC
jgi:hypothetical protein